VPSTSCGMKLRTVRNWDSCFVIYCNVDRICGKEDRHGVQGYAGNSNKYLLEVKFLHTQPAMQAKIGAEFRQELKRQSTFALKFSKPRSVSVNAYAVTFVSGNRSHQVKYQLEHTYSTPDSWHVVTARLHDTHAWLPGPQALVARMT